ncbi:MAG: hypothetical protein WB770_09145 [Acidimicrobiales bacterium]
MRVAAFVVGIILIVATWGGVIAVFVVPRGRSLFQRLPSKLIFGVYRLFVWMTHLFPRFRSKDGVLAAAGALALVVQLISFLALFVIGFALALVPWTHGFPLAIRQAASALFIVGIADIQSHTNEYLVVFGAVTGAVSVAIQIGYLPVIYGSFSRREALVTMMESRAGVPAWGPEVLIRQELVATLDSLPDFYREWESWSAEVAESHSTYPVLNLFRSPRPGFSWLLSLLAVMDAAALHLALAPSVAPSEARLCLRMGFTALRRIAFTLHWSFDRDPKPDDPLELTYDDFAQAVEQLRDVGFPIEREPQEAWPHFHGWRVNYETLAYRFADYLVTPHAPWSGPRKHLRPDVLPPDRPPHREPSGEVHEEGRFRPNPRRATRG